jgi:iron(III) transport system substrate-binding protein
VFRKITFYLLILALVAIAVSCAPAPAPTAAPAVPVAPAATAAPVATTALPAPTTAPAPTTSAAKDPYKGLTSAQDAWAKAAQVGSYQPATLDWDAIKAAAVKEAKVVVYSNSSRWSDVKKTFEAQYPGITVEGYDISGPELLTKVKTEQKAGIYNVDVLFVGDPTTQVNEMYYPPNKMIWSFVPDFLFPKVKTTDVMSPVDMGPLLVHHYSNSTWSYNNEVYKETPIKNWWDMTKPEWKGRINIKDPQSDAGVLNCFTTVTQHADDMAKAYEAAFGKAIKLDSGVPNAGYQWIKDLGRNQPMIAAGGDDVATNVGTVGQKSPPIGFASWSKIRNSVPYGGKLMFDMMNGLQPVMGCFDTSNVSLANQAPHPNAAKLIIQWYMGDDKGQLGNAPYYVPGDNSPRKDVAVPKGGVSLTDLAKIAWRNDADYLYANAIQVRDFWVANLTAK